MPEDEEAGHYCADPDHLICWAYAPAPNCACCQKTKRSILSLRHKARDTPPFEPFETEG